MHYSCLILSSFQLSFQFSVCSLAFNNSCGLLLSCSWDKTARLWRDDQCVTTLAGHEAAVWTGVFLPNGDGVITGSADKTLRLWRPMSFSQAKFSCEQKYIGHCDCVRGVAMLNAEEFVSCGNDATVRIWKISGECIRVSHFSYRKCVLVGKMHPKIIFCRS